MEYMRKIFKRKIHLQDDLEPPEDYVHRWNSIYVIYFTMFLMSLGFSIVLTGVWPYLETLDPKANKEFIGWVVAANPTGQMLFSPLVGWWGNKLNKVRLPLALTLALFVCSSMLYSILEIMPGNKLAWMIVARFFVGVSSANIAVARSYISAATRTNERTKAVSMISLAQTLGFVIGPAIQAAVTPLNNKGFLILGLPVNMYTMAGWTNVIMGVLNLILFHPWIFKERKISAREAMKLQGKATEKEAMKSFKPDYIAVWSLVIAFFVLIFNFVILETLATPLTMEQFAWTKQVALKNLGIMMSVGAAVATLIFLLIRPICKRFSERKVLIWGGIFIMIIGRIFCIPWGPGYPVIAEKNLTLNLTNDTNDVEIVGCPSEQKWCYYTPQMTILQFMIGYGFTTIGYPIGITLVQTIYSKILGPRKQGVWMGVLTGAGCFARIVGPIFISYIYTGWGTYHTFGITGATLIVAMILLQIVDKNLIVNHPEKDAGELKDQEAPLFTDDHPKDIEMHTLELNSNANHINPPKD